MDLFSRIKGFKPINEQVQTELQEPKIRKGFNSYLIFGRKVGSENAELKGEDILKIEYVINNDPAFKDARTSYSEGDSSGGQGLGIFSSDSPQKIQAELAKISDINDYELRVKAENTSKDINKYSSKIREELEKAVNDFADIEDEVDDMSASDIIEANNKINYNIGKANSATSMLKSFKNKEINKNDEQVITVKKNELVKRKKLLKIKLSKKLQEGEKELVSLKNKDKESEEFKQEIGELTDEYKQMEKSDIVDEKQTQQRKENITQVKAEKGVSGKELNDNLNESKLRKIEYKIQDFIRNQYKTVENVVKDYTSIMGRLDQMESIFPEDVAKMRKRVQDRAEIRIAVLRGIDEKETLGAEILGSETDKDADPSEKIEPSTIESGTIESTPGTEVKSEYVLDVFLPLGKEVIVNNLHLLKGIGDSITTKYASFYTLIKQAANELIAYEPQGGAAANMNAYSFTGTYIAGLMGWLTGNLSAAILAIFGKNGVDTGHGIGRFLKHEMVASPERMNPELEKLDQWAAKRFNLKKPETVKVRGSSKSRPIDLHQKKRVRNLHEKVPTRNTEEIRENVGVAPGGGVLCMNVPGMVVGIGNPTPATPDQVPGTLKSDSGSGDNFNPKRKKKFKDNNINQLKKM